jgi:hypothetical protein
MSIQFTPFRVAVVTGLVVFASIGAPRIAGFRDTVREKVAQRIADARGSARTVSAQSSTSSLIKYKDNSGRTFYVSSLETVPTQYRATAELNPRLPKVTYSDFPIQELRKPHLENSEISHAPLLAQNRKQGAHNQVNNFNSSSFSNGQREGRAEARGKGEPGGGDDGSDFDGSDISGLGGSGGRDRIGYIKKWLFFVRDTFNQASTILSGAK